jgi:peptidoglycan/LPS O-acetylase OafA/YrhL
MNKNSPFRLYVVAGHIAWLIISPIIFFIGGGSWLINRFNWDSWLMLVFVLLGIAVMVSGVWSYLKKMLDMYYSSKNPGTSPEKHDKRDYDFYD